MRASQAVAWAAGQVGRAGARTLVAHVLGVEPTALAWAGELTATQLDALAEAVGRRSAGEPVQHITGRAWFRTVGVAVGPGVFIPRPETELLAGWALERIAAAPDPSDLTVVELCAGSGAISLALATEAPGPAYHAVELSADAWPYLTANLAGSGVTPQLGDMATALPELAGRVDLVVVNPPYVPSGAREGLPADVLADPALALFAGDDGLDALRVVADVAARLIAPGGWLAAEHDDSHGESVPALLAAHGAYDEIADHPDLAGRPRYVTARRTARLAR